MSCCDGCPRRSERCHADCADYLAERVLAASEGRKRAERELNTYEAEMLTRGGRRKTGKKVYKRNGAHWWRSRRIDTGK